MQYTIPKDVEERLFNLSLELGINQESLLTDYLSNSYNDGLLESFSRMAKELRENGFLSNQGTNKEKIAYWPPLETPNKELA